MPTITLASLMDAWAAFNTVVILFALGLGYHQQRDAPRLFSAPVWRALLGYNLLLPGMGLLAVVTLQLFAAPVITGMALCIACAGGTSAGALVLAARGSGAAAALLIVASVALSLFVVAGFSALNLIPPGEFSYAALALYLAAISLLPLLGGFAFQRQFPRLAERLRPPLEKLGSALVILLVVVLAVRHGQAILTGPAQPMLAAALLVLLFALPPLLEQPASWRRTLVLVTLVRNLSLVLSLLVVLPDAAAILPTVLAFGLFMYIAAFSLLGLWRRADRRA